MCSAPSPARTPRGQLQPGALHCCTVGRSRGVNRREGRVGGAVPPAHPYTIWRKIQAPGCAHCLLRDISCRSRETVCVQKGVCVMKHGNCGVLTDGILIWKLEWKRPLEGPRHKWKDIQSEVKEITQFCLNGINQAHDKHSASRSSEFDGALWEK